MKAILQLILLTLLVPQILNAQLVNDFRVNDDTTAYWNINSAVDTDKDGNIIIVWEDYRRFINGVRIGTNILCQRYNQNGIPIGENFIINQFLDSSSVPDLAVKSDGRFAVTWLLFNNSISKIAVRLFNKDAIPITADFIINDSAHHLMDQPKIVSDKSGGYVITWKIPYKIYSQRIDSLGNRIGSNFIVNEILGNHPVDNPDITSFTDGRFVITWQDSRPPSLFTNDIYMQRYDSEGNKIGINQRVNDNLNPEDHQQFPKISSDTSGRFVIGWTDYNNLSIDSYIQLFNSDGSKQGNNINIGGNGDETIRAISKKANGDMIVVYGDGIGFSFPQYCQRFNSQGQFIGSRYPLSNFPVDYLYTHGVKIYDDRVIATWSDERTGNFDVFCNVRSFTNPDSTVRINQISSEVPEEYKLYRNYPNPFNPSTNIRFDISKTSDVKLSVYDITGREVSVLVNEKLLSGSYEFTFNSTGLSSGVYIYRIKAADFTQTRKMLLVK